MNQSFRWGHININVADLDISIAFYEALGFELLIPSIPYLGLDAKIASAMPEATVKALAVPPGTTGRACIMQLGKGLPKLDLTEFSSSTPRQSRPWPSAPLLGNAGPKRPFCSINGYWR